MIGKSFATHEQRGGVMIRPPSAKPWHMPCNFGTPNPKEGLQNPSSLRLAPGVSVGDDAEHGSDHAWP
ncbi:MAG TPA: hypothetical protein DCM71_27740 [Runella sp.]|nr:hypothetical protein [Runella sp.]